MSINIAQFTGAKNEGQWILRCRLEAAILEVSSQYKITPIEIIGALEFTKLNYNVSLPREGEEE